MHVVSDNKVNVSVVWKEHFINKVHHEGQLLAEIEKYPVQFKELEDDGILMSMKKDMRKIIVKQVVQFFKIIIYVNLYDAIHALLIRLFQICFGCPR